MEIEILPKRSRSNDENLRDLDVNLLFNSSLLISKRDSCSIDLLSIARKISSPDFADSVLLVNTAYHDRPGLYFRIIFEVKVCLNSLAESRDRESEKFIIIHEADLLPRHLQNVLEFYTWLGGDCYNVTFILTFSSISRFNRSLSSRFSKFSFKALERNELKEILSHICEEQHSRLDDETFTTIYNGSNGTLRSVIECFKEAEPDFCDDVIKISNVPVSHDLKNAEVFIKMCSGSPGTADCSRLKNLVNTILEGGSDMSVFLNEVLDEAIKQKYMVNQGSFFTCVCKADQNIKDYDGDQFKEYVHSQLLEFSTLHRF